MYIKSALSIEIHIKDKLYEISIQSVIGTGHYIVFTLLARLMSI